ncbi:MAG: HYR domain-containing protein, partial [Acidimicrobiia bacterium]
APGDYAALLDFPIDLIGVGSVPLALTVVDDDELEPGELFTVTIELAAGSDPECAIGDGTATMSIAASDGGANTPPFVTIDQAVGQADPTTASPIVFDVEFTEPVTGFDASDVSFAGSTTDATLTPTVTGGPQLYSVSVAAAGATMTGTVIASIPAGVASDGAATNFASTSDDNSVTLEVPDTTAPSVTVNQAVGQADPTSASPIVFTVVFSEPVSGFATGDVTLGGTAGAASAVVSGSGSSYTVAVSGMTAAGTVIASVGAGVATDAALNPNLASTSTDNTVTYEPVVGAPLSIDVPDDIVTDNDPGEAGAVVDFSPASASGGTPPLTVTCDRTSGEFFPLGTTTVTCTASDGEDPAPSERFVEATVTATFTITVVDVESPVIADPPDLVRSATTTNGVAVGYTTPTASDNAGPPVVTCAPGSGTVFAVGTTNVTCTATDAAGNSASASLTVTVTAPGSGAVPPDGLPATGSDLGGVLALAALWLVTGLASRRIVGRLLT